MLYQDDPRLEYCRRKTLKIKRISAAEMEGRHSSEERNGDADRLEVLNGSSKARRHTLNSAQLGYPAPILQQGCRGFTGAGQPITSKALSAQQLLSHRSGMLARTQ